MVTQNNSNKGKKTELMIASHLIDNDLEVYLPVVDTGIDMLVRKGDGAIVELQVKSRDFKDDEGDFFIKDYKSAQALNFFIVLVDLRTNDFWVYPSMTFRSYAEQYKQKGKDYLRLPFSFVNNNTYWKNKNGVNLILKALQKQIERGGLVR
ncbi:MAG: hypothetical protein Q8L34_01445 [Candidatus Woesearchaeota archaeon]|nr:hypothetical protein [Candidatus Woesearchaeota archaeon]